MDFAFWVLVAVAVVVVCALLVLIWRLTTRIRLRDAETHHLVIRRLPALMDAERGLPIDVPGPVSAQLAETTFGHDVQSAVGQFAGFAEESQQRAERTARSTLISSMHRMQEHADELRDIIAQLPDGARVRVELEHRCAQLIRRAQATALLCGSRPAQRHHATSLPDAVSAATARIRDHSRIEVHNDSTAAVIGRTVEPVILVLAEFLDNAARYSPPETPVQLHFQPAHNGLSVVVDDAGPGVGDEQLERAKALLSGRESADVHRLGDPPRVGFAVAGLLAARCGFKTFVESASPYGGTRAVLFLPNDVLTGAEAETQPGAPEPWQRGTLMGAHAKLPDPEDPSLN
ncbi:ATP-binding protein [Saccharopolyspora griseoalba]|uniref:histidine kinase n=1 Tax=Saccharopolyspora griseoalba TaxID=1431848 RepID=A0ABW2LMK9_9PSEU